MSPHHLPALILALIGAALLLRWLIGDRARGRRRCPRCWYDMAGIDTLACPECGRRARSDRALRRSHRRPRWLLAGIAIVALATYTVTTAQSRRAETWTKYVPTTAYLLTDRTVAQGGPLYQRLSSHAMWDWQARVAFRRLLPPHVRQNGHQPGIAYLKNWPTGVPIPLLYDSWQDSFHLASLGKTKTVLRDPRTGADLARPHIPDFTFTEQHHPRLWRGYAVTSSPLGTGLAAPAPDPRRPQFAIDAVITIPWKNSTLEIQRTRLTYAIQLAGTPEDRCKPVDRPELTDALRRTLRLDGATAYLFISYLGPDEPDIPRNYLSLTASFGGLLPPFDDVAIGVRFDFLRNDEVVGTARHLVPDPATSSSASINQGLHIEGDWQAILDATLNPEGWTVRVTSDLDAVFSDMNNLKPRYWRGQFTVPLADVARPIRLLPAPCPP